MLYQSAVGQMIILKDYFNNKIAEVTPAISLNGLDLLYKVNRLLADYVTKGNVLRVSPKTGCLISGNKDGDGGMRLQSSGTGSPNSAHKQGMAVDIYDPQNKLDDYLTDEILTKFDLYREAPESTLGWCHLSTRKPPSSRRTFKP